MLGLMCTQVQPPDTPATERACDAVDTHRVQNDLAAVEVARPAASVHDVCGLSVAGPAACVHVGCHRYIYILLYMQEKN